MISVDAILEQKFPNANRKRIFYRVFNSCLKHLFHENEFQSFARRFPYLKGFEFVEQVLEEFNMSVQVNSEQVERIPSSGRVVIVANHPLGSLDGLALIREIGQIRRDLKVVATSILNELKPMQSLLIPVDNVNNKVTKSYFKNIDQHLEYEGALLIFPAGEVSRITPLGVRDAQWQAGFLRMAHRAKAPILPIFVDARNSFSFYLASMLYRPLSTFMLVPEMFKRRNSHIKLTIGRLIPYASFEADVLESKAMVKLFAKHVYRLGAGKSELFKTQSSIAHPEDRQLLREAIDECVTLGATEDSKKICLFQGETSSPIMREIGRLREVTFRAVGEGSGNRRDFDNYDTYYHHILLWDDADLEIVGAYRIGLVDQIKAAGLSLYTESLFNYDESMEPYFEFAMELGRSFVQPKYWGKRSLDYLWQGIGAFLRQHPKYRYMIGPVTVPNTLPELAKRALLYVFNKHFYTDIVMCRAKRPFKVGPEIEFIETFNADSYENDAKLLKHYMASMGASIPTLYKQYADLCCPGGLKFLDYGIDTNFGNAIDSLIMLDTYYLKDKKRKRYIG